MSKVKKLYALSEECVMKIEKLIEKNPNMSASGIVEAAIMCIPDDATIEQKMKVEYTISK